MSTMKYATLDLGTIEGVFNKLGGLEGAQRFLRGELVVIEPKHSDFLRLLSTDPIVIGETDGKHTIAQARDVFLGYIDSDFKNWGLDVAGEAKSAIPVQVHELVTDGRFDQFFPSLGKLDDLCLEQDQIIQFCREHKKWLRTEGYATFFLLKMEGKFFVASVYFDGVGRLSVCVFHFSNDGVWSAKYRVRIVVPQLCQSAA